MNFRGRSNSNRTDRPPRAISLAAVNPDHPGGSGALQAVAAAEGLKGTDIVDSFDIVGFDPRGVGASPPAIDCLIDEQSDQDGIVFPMEANQEDWTADDSETLVDQRGGRSGSEALLANVRASVCEAAPFIDPGVGVSDARDGCESWPAENDLTYPYATDVEGLPYTLTVSITGDPTTPYQGGVSLADTLGGSLLTVEGVQHTITMSGASECVNTIVTAYLADLRTPEQGSSCTLG